MKLLYCSNCGTVFSLSYTEKKCFCEEVSGAYEKDGKMLGTPEAFVLCR